MTNYYEMTQLAISVAGQKGKNVYMSPFVRDALDSDARRDLRLYADMHGVELHVSDEIADNCIEVIE